MDEEGRVTATPGVRRELFSSSSAVFGLIWSLARLWMTGQEGDGHSVVVVFAAADGLG
jgi:hypothetical protein